MSTVAEQLRQAREAKNLTVYQVAEITKIRTDHIRALDEGDYDIFSAPVYIRGFVRTYATLLKLDVPQVLGLLSQELAKSEKHREPPPLTKARRGILDVIMYQLSKLNWRVVGPTLAVALIVAGAIFIFRNVSSNKAATPAPNQPAAVYQPQKKASDTLPLQPPPAQSRR